MGGWGQKMAIFMIYGTVNHQRGGSAKKSQKHYDVMLEWSLGWLMQNCMMARFDFT